VTRVVTPAGWSVLLGALAAYALGVGLGYPSLVGIGLAGLLAFAVACAAVLVRPRLRVERAIAPDRVTVGEPALGQVTTRNLSRWPSPGFVVVDRLGGEPLELPVSGLPGTGTRTVHYPVPTRRRGALQLGPITVDRLDPLRLLRRPQGYGATETLWVHPRVHLTKPLPVGVVLDYEGRLADSAPRGTVTFSSLRDYVPGDDPRQIHWRSTARTGKLIVREHVDTSEPTVTVVLDTRPSVLAGAAFEAAVEVAASVAVGSERHGHPVALHVLGEDRAAVERAGATGLLDRLAAAVPAPADDPVALLDLVERAAPGGALAVVTGQAEQGVVARLSSQRRRFAPVVVLSLGDGDPGSARRPGMSVLRARTAADAVAAWNRLVTGART
jgi:uncharacterized protein (DUF58 family)